MRITANLRKAMAAVAVFSVVMLGGTATALADTPSTVTQDKGTLTIHKHQQPATPGAAGDGKELPTAPADPIKGVVFTVYKVKNVDLKTNAGWEKAEGLIKQFKANPAMTLDTDTGKALTATNDSGITTQTLDIGLYLVKETDVSNAAKPDGTKLGVNPSAPFLVTIPMADSTANGGWNYNVHVYPKNAVLTGTKSVTDDKVNLGDKATFTITTDIPEVAKVGDTETSLQKYVVIDKLPTGMEFTKDSGDIAVKLLNGGSISLADSDYSVTDAKTNPVKVTFTSDGLVKLAKARRADAKAKVEVTLKAKIVSWQNNGSYENEAFFAPSNEYSDTPGDPNKPPISTNKVVTKLGQISILKYANGDAQKKPLAGATFKLAYCDTPAKFLTIGGKDSWTTTADQKLVIQGLHLSNHYNGAEQTAVRKYCLFETAAPSGYQKAPQPLEFEVKSENMATPLALNFPNVKEHAGINLPLTGSNALILVSIAGVLLASGGLFLYGRGRRKNS